MIVRNCSFASEEHGNVAILTAIVVPALVLLAFGGLQFSNVASIQRAAQSAVDSATLTATLDLGRGGTRSEAREAGYAAFAANIQSASRGLDSATLPDFTFAVLADDVEVTATYTSPVEFPFNGVLGLPAYQISVDSSAFVTVPRDEVALVLDVSASMVGAEFDAMKLAATNFIQQIGPFEPEAGSYRTVNLIPFANRVNLGAENVDILAPETAEFPETLYEGCVRTEAPDSQASDSNQSFNNLLPFAQSLRLPQNFLHCPPEASRVLLGSGDEAELVDRINNLELAWGTGTDHALSWGWRSLSPNWRNRLDMPFGLPQRFVERNSKTLILLTDGRVVSVDYQPDGSGNDVLETGDRDLSLDAFIQVCDEIADQGNIAVYTVGYSLPAGSGSIRDALINCATGGGQYFDASVSGLDGIFQNIAGGINTVRLTK